MTFFFDSIWSAYPLNELATFLGLIFPTRTPGSPVDIQAHTLLIMPYQPEITKDEFDVKYQCNNSHILHVQEETQCKSFKFKTT
jgi:hypothetical protein